MSPILFVILSLFVKIKLLAITVERWYWAERTLLLGELLPVDFYLKDVWFFIYRLHRQLPHQGITIEWNWRWFAGLLLLMNQPDGTFVSIDFEKKGELRPGSRPLVGSIMN